MVGLASIHQDESLHRYFRRFCSLSYRIPEIPQISQVHQRDCRNTVAGIAEPALLRRLSVVVPPKWLRGRGLFVLLIRVEGFQCYKTKDKDRRWKTRVKGDVGRFAQLRGDVKTRSAQRYVRDYKSHESRSRAPRTAGEIQELDKSRTLAPKTNKYVCKFEAVLGAVLLGKSARPSSGQVLKPPHQVRYCMGPWRLFACGSSSVNPRTVAFSGLWY